ncbi:DUF1501 domain-containing protein [Gimesia aquarii]|uniref:DUF1501 domain-containing protein n=1 Tax=Gimesia aquarii TaxID=2527964 RepID=A0A517VZ33_9PLAN|nr:DUF1501 domain-containing protein [Gimesia aquarii]QDT98257.1 hypothetical protein V144x_37430 [Gimesia aquarii]
MFSILNHPSRTGNGITRRELLTTGGAGLLGLSLPKVLQAEQKQITDPFQGGRAKSVIFLFLFGGPSQLETFDLKPEAPSEIRGPFQSIDCRTPGLLISEHLPHLANVSDKYSVIRSMTHTFNDHSGGGHYIQTGKRWHIPIGAGFDATPKDWPSVGSVVEYLTQHTPGGLERDLPNYSVVPNRLGRLQAGGRYLRPGEYAGWLGRAYNPLTTTVDQRDSTDNPYWRDCTDEELSYEIEGLAPEVPLKTIRRRIALLKHFDHMKRNFDKADSQIFDQFRQRALALLTSDSTRNALNIQKEPETLRDQYGRHLFGQSCLMARRLVEAGVRFVTVHYDCVDGYSWDSHRNSDDVQHHLLPTFDQGAAALLTDLDQRGMLDETLVIAMGEMGRTPKPNNSWGRGHWSQLFPALIAGAGIQGGTTYGRSDRLASKPVEHPVSPEDLAATIYWAMGIDPGLMLPDALNRPVPINEDGEPLKQLFS